MAGRDYRFLDAHIARKGVKEVDEATTLKVHEQVVLASSDDGAYTITLPGVMSAEGKFYSILVDDEGDDNVTVSGVGLLGTYEKVMGTTNAFQLLVYSDGLQWHEVAFNEWD